MERTYAGIGSRDTPGDILLTMKNLSSILSRRGYKLRSGHAKGADKAFEHGELYGHKEIFIAEDSIGKDDWFELAEKVHPAGGRCNEWAKRLHARNGAIILGENLNDPVDFVICWTKDGKASGGTGQALRIAEAYAIPVYNLYHKDTIKRLKVNGLITENSI